MSKVCYLCKSKQTQLVRSTVLPGTNMQISPLSEDGDSTELPDHPLLSQPIELFSNCVEDFTADLLPLLLPRVMNPHGDDTY